MNRRRLLVGVGALIGAGAVIGTARGPGVEAAEPVAFAPGMVAEKARALAAERPRPRDAALPRRFADLDYDGYRRVRFEAAQALWTDDRLPFRVQMHHRGFLFREKVELHEVVGGVARRLRYAPGQFRFEGVQPPAETEDLGFAGFRLLSPLNRPDHFDELCSFLGASYFRALGRGQVYGLSARGLAIGTASPEGEEFPAFTEFWIERPAPQARSMRVHALLESESLTGAYAFDIAPGTATVMEVRCTLFPRRAVPRLGIAPCTSMFFFSPQSPGSPDDFRPAVHDSDGLLMRTGRGEELWRPLANPRSLQISGFQDEAPQGFGLVQRARAFADYQDLEAMYHRRPDLWVEPLHAWGAGEVNLVEIPTRSEIHDNISVAWMPRGGLAAGQDAGFHYRLHWRSHAWDGPLARFASTRIGAAHGRQRRLFVLDSSPIRPIEGPALAPLVEASAGELRDVVLQPNTETGGWRLAFVLEPGRASTVELRASIRRGETQVTEAWVFRWTA
jgi:glucans biosynthesis protein